MAGGTQRSQIGAIAVLRRVIQMSHSENPALGMFYVFSDDRTLRQSVSLNPLYKIQACLLWMLAAFAAMLTSPIAFIFDLLGYLLPVVRV
jgi:hypothetical protein